MDNYILDYYQKIQSGKIAACKRLIQQLKKLADEIDTPRDPWVFDIEKASWPSDFIERFCKQSKGRWIGQPLKLELFQKAIIQAIFGFVHKETGLRRCREIFTMVGRKCGKSTLMSALGLYMMIGDGEGGAEVYCVAKKRDQARIVFTEAVNMVSQSPSIRKHLKKRKTDLYFPATFSKFEPLASESNSLDGSNSHLVIIDELHAIKDRNIYDVMKQSMVSRQQPLMSIITTAGYHRQGIFDDIYDYACRVLNGEIEDDRFLAFIYELDERNEWLECTVWEKANPSLGVMKDYAELAANVERARNNAAFLPTVLTKDFNYRETVAGTWLTFEEADNNEIFDIESLRDNYAVGGVDLGATTDLTAAVALVHSTDNRIIHVITQCFMPAASIDERSNEDKVPYNRWAEQGLITLCSGNRVDYCYVTDWFKNLRETYGIYVYWVGYDSWNSPAWVEDMEIRIGYKKNETLLPVIMGGKTLSAPMKELKADLSSKNINYNNNPVMKWALTNMSVIIDRNENIAPVKGHNKRQRIDPAVALIIAYTMLKLKNSDYAALCG